MPFRSAKNALQHAFTLIELLIVVAIIAILAAIAVPNFLEAQTRAKVSRVRADMRTVVTGTELYRVDHGRYPIPSGEDGRFLTNPQTAPDGWTETRTPVVLTTPIAYLNNRPPDAFAKKGSDEQHFYYTTLDYIRLKEGEHGDEEFRDFYRDLTGKWPSQPVLFSMLSLGPDQAHNVGHGHGHDHDHDDHGHDHDHNSPAIYDPTNGTISSGDIHFMGPGPGFL